MLLFTNCSYSLSVDIGRTGPTTYKRAFNEMKPHRPMGECQQVVARTNKECVGLHQTTSSGCDVAPVIEIFYWEKHGLMNM